MFSLLLCACKKYLELKPDKKLYVPTSLADCQALLDDYNTMNEQAYPGDGEVASDHYYVTDATYLSLVNNDERDNYIWSTQANHAVSSWSRPYKVVFNANLVLQVLENVNPKIGEEYDRVKGSALFFRGYALYSLASIYCKPHDETSSGNDLGVPVRLSPDIDQIYGRGTVQQTYQQIIQDLKSAADLLPNGSSIKSRPNKQAAYAALARVYLAMRDYTNAGIYADLSLKINKNLLNFYTLSTTATLPFSRFNDEVIFASSLFSFSILSQTNAKITKSPLYPLYDSYQSDDLRKQLFFRSNTGANANTFAFKGSYQNSASNLFNGLATDEMYLIRAECYARGGRTIEALKDLNDLLKTRWQVNKDASGNVISTKYVNYTASSPNEALAIILKEREKELIFRGIRWTDLRRLNKESFAVTISRTVNGITYSLPPNDLRYTLLIPQDVIINTGVPQNSR